MRGRGEGGHSLRGEPDAAGSEPLPGQGGGTGAASAADGCSSADCLPGTVAFLPAGRMTVQLREGNREKWLSAG